MKLLVDVNLTPDWVSFVRDAGLDAVHWTEVGDARASDVVILSWARDHGCVVFTHDLDFGVLLALTKAVGPSVVQLRSQETLPVVVGPAILAALDQHGDALDKGALVTVDPVSSRVRILPIHP